MKHLKIGIIRHKDGTYANFRGGELKFGSAIFATRLIYSNAVFFANTHLDSQVIEIFGSNEIGFKRK
jgi:hypothetical protein